MAAPNDCNKTISIPGKAYVSHLISTAILLFNGLHDMPKANEFNRDLFFVHRIYKNIK